MLYDCMLRPLDTHKRSRHDDALQPGHDVRRLAFADANLADPTLLRRRRYCGSATLCDIIAAARESRAAWQRSDGRASRTILPAARAHAPARGRARRVWLALGSLVACSSPYSAVPSNAALIVMTRTGTARSISAKRPLAVKA